MKYGDEKHNSQPFRNKICLYGSTRSTLNAMLMPPWHRAAVFTSWCFSEKLCYMNRGALACNLTIPLIAVWQHCLVLEMTATWSNFLQLHSFGSHRKDRRCTYINIWTWRDVFMNNCFAVSWKLSETCNDISLICRYEESRWMSCYVPSGSKDGQAVGEYRIVVNSNIFVLSVSIVLCSLLAKP